MTDLTPLLERHPFTEGLLPEHIALMAGCARNLKFQAGMPFSTSPSSGSRAQRISRC